MQQLMARAEIVIGDGSGSWLVRREQREQRVFVRAIDGRDAAAAEGVQIYDTAAKRGADNRADVRENRHEVRPPYFDTRRSALTLGASESIEDAAG